MTEFLLWPVPSRTVGHWNVHGGCTGADIDCWGDGEAMANELLEGNGADFVKDTSFVPRRWWITVTFSPAVTARGGLLFTGGNGEYLTMASVVTEVCVAFVCCFTHRKWAALSLPPSTVFGICWLFCRSITTTKLVKIVRISFKKPIWDLQ